MTYTQNTRPWLAEKWSDGACNTAAFFSTVEGLVYKYSTKSLYFSAETDLEELKDATKSYRKEFRVSNKGSSFYSFFVIFVPFIF